MSGAELGKLVRQIDSDILCNQRQLEEDVAEYIARHKDKIVEALLQRGTATIPTFAGDVSFTEEDLRRVAKTEPELAAA